MQQTECEQDIETTELTEVDTQDPEIREEAKKILESILFASQEPLTLKKIKHVLDQFQPFPNKDIKLLIEELSEEYRSQKRAFCLDEIADGYALCTSPIYGPYIAMLQKQKRAEKLSTAAMEVLSIVAYRQPITKPKIEAIRGVDSSGIMQTLLDRELIESVGKLEVPGRPTLYGTTKTFLQYFGLRDLNDLPQIENNQED